ncbi:unnamed protein product [Rotaria sp. Silwood1]|nr:unnamed protein product [Rotaria sp. Silwood1]
MNTFGYLYNNSFVPPDLSQNLVASNNDGVDNQEFRLYIWLDTVTTYVLVVTTFNPNVTGPFSINVTGLASVTFSPMNASASNNDGAGNHQFRVYIWLDTATTYYLVVTTNKPIVTGQFTVIVTGLGSLTLSPMNASGKSQIRFRILL